MFPFVALAPMDVQNTLATSARTEVRETVGSDPSELELEADPTLRYDLIAKHGLDHFVALYSPRFIIPGLQKPGSQPVTFLNNGGAGFEAERPRYHLSVYEYAAYGEITTTALLVQKPWNGDGVPARPNAIIPSDIAARFSLLFSSTSAAVDFRLTRLVTVTPTVVYNAFGGANSDSRATIPMVYGPGGGLALAIKTSRENTWKTTLGGGGAQTLFQGSTQGPTITRAEGEERLTHKYSELSSSEAAIGFSIANDTFEGAKYYTTGEFNTVLGFRSGRDLLQLAFVARVAPWIDLFSGDLEQRAEGIAAMNWTIQKVTLRTQGTVAKTIFNPETVSRYQVVIGDLGVVYKFTPEWSTDGGVRVGYQDFTNAYRANTTTQVMFYGGVTWTPKPFHL